MRVTTDKEVTYRAITGRWDETKPKLMSIGDFEKNPKPGASRFPTEQSEKGTYSRVIEQLQGFELWLVTMMGPDYEGVTADLVRDLRLNRGGRLWLVDVTFLYYSIHAQICLFYHDIRFESQSQSFPDEEMKDPPTCASLLKKYLGDMVLSAEAQEMFLKRELCRIDYGTKTVKRDREPSKADDKPTGGAEDRGKKKSRGERRAAQRVRAAAKGAVAPAPPQPKHDQEPGNGRQPIKQVGGVCLFYLGGFCGVRNKQGTGPMACFAMSDNGVCPHGSHEAISTAQAASLAQALEQAIQPGQPHLCYGPGVSKRIIAFLKGLRN
jgi:hypothetical protein